MSELKEYVVTLKNREDLGDFYVEMESARGCDCIPEREVEITNRRPLSRNTHFMLTDEEVERLSQDPRVLAIENPNIYRMSVRPEYLVDGNFNKSNSIDTATHKNWAHYRCVNGETVLNWGNDGNPNLTETANITATGKHVDVIIIDGHIDPAHPEYAVNQDGSGGSRVVQFDWFTLNNLVSGVFDDDGAGLLTGPYQYAPYVDPSYPIDRNENGISDRTEDNNHGAHVAGTVAGNTYGWAKDANIYNISPLPTNQNNLDGLAMWDYIRAFHASKPVNSATGRRNPTICNGSYGSALTFPATFSNGDVTGPITRAVYRGVDTGVQPTGLSLGQLQANGFRTTTTITTVPYFSGSIIADIEDAIEDGIIVVGAAGNSYWNIAGVGEQDYANIYYATYNGTNYFWYTSRGSAPAATQGAICVGAASNVVNEQKAFFSNCGPRVDIYAPGQSILSSLNDGSITDPRDINYFLSKFQGTSMASPQVCGVLACALEIYPNMTPAQALEYLIEYATNNQMFDSGGGIMDSQSLQGAPNRYLFFKKERLDDGNVFPKKNYYIRPTRGCVYPRSRIRRRG